MQVLHSTPIKVLLVDDEPHILTAIEFLLEQQGIIVEKAMDAHEAMDKLLDFQPQVAVLDVMMPGMDGFELAKKIRAIPNYENIRIVFLTAKGTEKDRWAGYASGGEVYITKPFDNQHLVETITEMVAYG